MTAPTTVYAARAAVLRTLARGPHSGAALRRAVKYQDRDGLAAALSELTAAGLVVAETARAGGTRYVLAEPVYPSIPAVESRRNASLMCDRCEARRRRPTGHHCGACLAELARAAVTP
ncbi:MAG: hypothetical protein ACSLE6_06460 [Mycobacterium sp.]